MILVLLEWGTVLHHRVRIDSSACCFAYQLTPFVYSRESRGDRVPQATPLLGIISEQDTVRLKFINWTVRSKPGQMIIRSIQNHCFDEIWIDCAAVRSITIEHPKSGPILGVNFFKFLPASPNPNAFIDVAAKYARVW